MKWVVLHIVFMIILVMVLAAVYTTGLVLADWLVGIIYFVILAAFANIQFRLKVKVMPNWLFIIFIIGAALVILHSRFKLF